MRNYGICLLVAFRCGQSGNGIACAGSLSLQEPTIPRRSAAIYHCLAGADFVFRSDHRESQPSTIARKFCSTASKPPVQQSHHTSRAPRISKHKKTPHPKRIAGLFGVTEWCWLQRRKRYWHSSQPDGWCRPPKPKSLRASLHTRQCLGLHRLSRVGGGILICLQFLSTAKIRKFGL